MDQITKNVTLKEMKRIAGLKLDKPQLRQFAEIDNSKPIQGVLTVNYVNGHDVMIEFNLGRTTYRAFAYNI